MTKFSIALFFISTFLYCPNILANKDNTEYYKVEKIENSKLVNSLSGSNSLGHLLSTNNNTLAKGRVSIGTLYAGYGVTDNLTIATSPFLMQQFSAYNLFLKGATRISKNEDIGLDIGYISSLTENDEYHYINSYCEDANCESITEYTESFKETDEFEMEVWLAKLTYGKKISPYYKANVTASYFYYVNEWVPFSFRMDPQNNDAFSLNLTSLHEIKLDRNLYLNFEIGGWGLNYTYPYIHSGVTINAQYNNFFTGVGFTSTFSPWFPKEKAGLKEYKAEYDSRASFHPEIQIQMIF